MATGFYHLTAATIRTAGFLMLQAARAEACQDLWAIDPVGAKKIQAVFNAENDKVYSSIVAAGVEMKVQWQKMSPEERTEMIMAALTEGIGSFYAPGFMMAGAGKAWRCAGDKFKAAAEIFKKPGLVALTTEGLPLAVEFAQESELASELSTLAEGAEGAQGVEKALAKAAEAESLQPAATFETPYSGELVKVPKPDPQAEKLLAQRFKDGQTCVKFKNDPTGKEFDIITKDFIIETKPALESIGSPFRRQAKRAFEAAKHTGRKVYFHFDGEPCGDILSKLNEYQRRYGIEMVIDTKPLV